jgi:putative ABC transport system ATP-binding protein
LSYIEYENVSFLDGEKVILDNISVSIEKGDFLSIIGPSGSGKSTFLKLCCNLISPSKGKVIYDSRNYLEYNPSELRKRIAYCFQIPYLFGRTVMDNLAFPFDIRNKSVDMNRIEELFSSFQMDMSFMNKETVNLSGGEKQRIALIRNLIFLPDVLLLDEVTSSLDVDNSTLVENAVLKLNQSGTTVLWVTHNLEQSKRHANKLIEIEAGRIKSLKS